MNVIKMCSRDKFPECGGEDKVLKDSGGDRLGVGGFGFGGEYVYTDWGMIGYAKLLSSTSGAETTVALVDSIEKTHLGADVYIRSIRVKVNVFLT